jgi:WD40 repeat protein
VSSGKLRRTLKGHDSYVFSIAVSRNGKTLISGSADKSVKLWNVQTGRTKQTFTGHSDGVRAVAISPDGRTVASGSEDKTARLWQLSER